VARLNSIQGVSLETFAMGSAAKMAPATNTTQGAPRASCTCNESRFSITSIDLIGKKILPSPKSVSRNHMPRR
jgi:hypothetical protein